MRNRRTRHTEPVFVDRSGRRRRIMMLTGIGVAAALLAGLAVMVAGVFGASALALPGFPTGTDRHLTPTHRVTPSGPADPSPATAGTATSGATPTATSSRTPSACAVSEPVARSGDRDVDVADTVEHTSADDSLAEPARVEELVAMAAHVNRREPRAHWILLALAMIVLLGELCINGYVRHVGAEGSGPQPASAGPGNAAPAAVTGAGPVLRIDPDGQVHSRAMPADTIALTFDDGPDPQLDAADPGRTGPPPRARHVLRDRLRGQPVPGPVPGRSSPTATRSARTRSPTPTWPHCPPGNAASS